MHVEGREYNTWYLWGSNHHYCYVLNRSIIEILDIILEEIFPNSNPFVKHMRIFDVLSFKHIPNQISDNLKDENEPTTIGDYYTAWSNKL